MKNSPERFRTALRENLLDLLWRQWRSLGVAGRGPEAARPVDLEALVLATATAAEQDLRLWNAALGWLAGCREWLNGARLKRMAVPFSRPDERLKRPLIGADAWQQVEAALDPALKALHKGGKSPGSAGVLTPPRLRKPPLLQLLLRGVFGVNARAELILFLLMKGEGNSNQIARETHYDQKNVYLILERWVESGLVGREKRGRQNLYALKPGMPLPLPAKVTVDFWRWEPFFRQFGRLLIAALSEPWREDAYLLSSLFRGVHGDLSAFARAAGIALPDPQLFPAEKLFAPMAEELVKIPGRF